MGTFSLRDNPSNRVKVIIKKGDVPNGASPFLRFEVADKYLKTETRLQNFNS